MLRELNRRWMCFAHGGSETRNIIGFLVSEALRVGGETRAIPGLRMPATEIRHREGYEV
jgi:hypothetical protein